MKKNDMFYKEMIQIALPVTAQCVFQSSLSFLDQLMVGQLGSVLIAGSGLGAKFCSLYMVTLSAVSATASILIAQYSESKHKEGIGKSFFFTVYAALAVMFVFLIPSLMKPEWIMSLYSKDTSTCLEAAGYLQILSVGFPAVCGTSMLSALLRSMKKTKYPLYTSIISIVLNLSGNYLLIFGKCGFPVLELRGAAIATTLARYVEFAILLVLFWHWNQREKVILSSRYRYNFQFLKGVCYILAPILINEFLWSLGENVYAAIYGRMSTNDLAAMTLTGTMQGLFVGLFSGVATAAQVMTGNRLGRNDKEEAYFIGKRLLLFGFLGSVLLGIVVISAAGFYVQLFQVSLEVKRTTIHILWAFGILLFSKVCNMILGGGILRSGGKTTITLIIDLIGTWGIGIPLGLLMAFYFHQPIELVYFVLSLEECVRLFLGILVLRSRKWMKNVTGIKEQASDSLSED